MSNDSSTLRAAEYASMVLAILNLVAAAWAATPGTDATDLKTPLLLGFGFYFFIALLIASQFTQLARQLDPSQPTGDDLDGLRVKELKRLLKWAPLPHRIAGAIGLIIFVSTFLLIGGVTWTTDSPFEHRHALGIGLYFCALYAIATPVLAALVRLPPAPDERIKALTGNDA